MKRMEVKAMNDDYDLELMRTPEGGLYIVGNETGEKILHELWGVSNSADGPFFYAKIKFKDPLTDNDVAGIVAEMAKTT
jgi:hypothetical protein